VSLIGIDVGTSAVKLAAFAVDDGRELASVRRPVGAEHPGPGLEELDPEAVWDAVREGLAELAAGLRDDPPAALAVSASGDEVFPVAGGRSLGPCLLSGDTRGADVEAATLARRTPAEWLERCGHVPERMDPVNRVLWWRAERPDVADRAEAFLGWHEYLCLRLCGRAATDPGLAAKWLAFDLLARDWSAELLGELELPREALPEVLDWGERAGTVEPALAAELRLPADVVVGVGGYDSSCAALGSGVADPSTHGLACGSWEVVVAPTGVTDLAVLAPIRASAIPYPGGALAALAQSSDGSSAPAWAAGVLGRQIESYEDELTEGPGPVLAIPRLSGARGALLGLSLATSGAQIAQAMLEGVAYDLALTVEALGGAGISAETIRAAGGGTRSPWWMRLKAGLTGVPIEVGAHEEPGAFGAALLAGAAAGAYGDPAEAAAELTRVARRYEPDPGTARRYAETLALYREAVPRVAVIGAA
jgi:xylulokinase